MDLIDLILEQIYKWVAITIKCGSLKLFDANRAFWFEMEPE